MSRVAPSLAVALLVAVALAHAVQAGTSLAEELSQLGEISSKIEELKQQFKRDGFRNRGKNKYRKGKKNSGHRRKKAGQRKKKLAKQKKKSMRGRKKVGRRNKSGRRGNKFGGRGNKLGGRGNKSAKSRKKGNSRQTCDEQALCQKIKDFIKISNQLRKVKRIIKVCSLMENKAQKSATEFSATINSLTSALTASRMAGGPLGRRGSYRQTTAEVDDVTSIRDKLSNCSATVQTRCDKTTVEGCQNATLLTQCEKELKEWTTKFGPAKGSCLQASTDCCACITAIKDVSPQCLTFDKLTDAAVKKKSTCTSGNSEGSFGFCRKLQQEAAIKGPTVAKLHCDTAATTSESKTTTTTSAPLNTTLPLTTMILTTSTMIPTTTTMIVTTPVDLTLNVTSLEASVVTLLDTVGNLTTKVEAITIKVDANTAKGDANAAAIALKCDKSTCTTIQTAQTKLETCLGDVTNSDCPAVPSGKTGVATVSANAANLANKCDATKCTAVETKVTDVESCLADKTSAKCPAAASGKVSVPGAITALETPTVFSCYYNTPAITATTATLAGYTACDINVGTAMDKTTGIFTVAKAGKYRFTFMTLTVPENKKKVIALLNKDVGGTVTSVARALAQSKIGVEQEQITITLDVIVEVAVADKMSISISLTAPANIPEQLAAPWQTWFTGEYISA